MAERVLLTGATGFIGKGAARELSAAGCRLSVLIRGPNPRARAAAAGLDAEVRSGDLRDAATLAAAVRETDVVVHLAAVVDPHLAGDAAEVARTNYRATFDLAERARAAGVRRFVFVSSIAAMGFWSGRATAHSPCRPVSAYGRAKLDAETRLNQLRQPGFDVVVLRPPTVYGPGERYNFLTWVRAVERGVFRVIGSGQNVFPLCTSENLARVAAAAAERRLDAGTYLVADAEAYPLERVYRAIAAALGRRPARLKLPKSVALLAGAVNELAARALPRVPLHLTRARVVTLTADQPFDVTPLLASGIRLESRLEQTVAETVDDYRAHGLLAFRGSGAYASGSA